MSSDRTPVPVPRTAVPIGIDDPVASARAELKAALNAIEEKVNVPKRLERATDDARFFARRNPSKALAIAAGAAVGVGATVWAVARLLSR